MLVDGFGFGGGWFSGFAPAGCVASVFFMECLAAAGFKELGLAAAGLVAGGYKHHQVHCPDTAEPTSVTKTTECNAAKPNAGKATGSSDAISGGCDNLLIVIIK